MSRGLGEAAWTARDLVTEWILTDPYAEIHGRFDNEHDALVRREYLIAEGIECWVVPVSDLEIEGDEPRFLTDCDPGDENDWRPPC